MVHSDTFIILKQNEQRRIINIIQRVCELIANTIKKKHEPDCDNLNDLDYF